jgi:uncharacterized membrane protein
MITRVRNVLEMLAASYWFVPAVLGLGAALLSLVTLSIDLHLPDDWLERVDVAALPTIQSEGARSVLTTVASSMITVAGVVFSLTLLVLTQASSQFGPRLLVNFMRDRTTQFVLGVFVATFVYALLGAASGLRRRQRRRDRLVRAAALGARGAGPDLPDGCGPGVLHPPHRPERARDAHPLRRSTTLSSACSRVSRSGPRRPTTRRAPRTCPRRSAPTSGCSRRGAAVTSRSVAIDALVESAAKRGAVVRLIPTVGDFVMKGAPLAEVQPATATDALADDVHGAVSIGTDRSLTQDLGFVFDELLEIALRALSPSLNDPFTARSCIDRIAQGLLLLDRRRLPPQVHADDEGVVRAFVPLQGKGALARHLFGELRRAAAGNLFVTQHLLETLAKLRREVGSVALGSAIDEAMEAIVTEAKGTLSALDHARLEAVLARFQGGDVGRAPDTREPADRTRR